MSWLGPPSLLRELATLRDGDQPVAADGNHGRRDGDILGADLVKIERERERVVPLGRPLFGELFPARLQVASDAILDEA